MSQEMGIPAAVYTWLNNQGIPALCGWSGEERNCMTKPIVVVTVRAYSAIPGGFEHYLGERYNEDTAAWEEFYGRKVELTLGLDLYTREEGGEGELQVLLERLVGTLTLGAPEGLQVGDITCGPAQWEEKQRCLKREVSAQCTAWLQAVAAEETEFLDFELRGGWKI